MNITSLEFALFAITVLILYFLIPGRFQNSLLLTASYVFLLIWNPEFALVFALLTAANFWIGRQVSPGKTQRRLCLWLGIGINLAALAYFKYADFFVPYVVYYLKRIGITISGDMFVLLMPVGLSFYIVQAIAYLLDVYKGTFQPATKLINFALYMVYFPRLISGPIERARDLLSQLDAPRKFKLDMLWYSFTLILIGLVRKIALADTLLLLLPDPIFITPNSFNAPDLVFWLLAYAFVIYNDFAGYTSIVRGVSTLFGIELSINFSTPYFARNFTEFWQRWHITLSSWLRDYIFTPLTRLFLRRKLGNRHIWTLTIPPLVTMIISALWHGASWNMLVWGAIHAFYQIGERMWIVWFKGKPPHLLPLWRQAIAALGVFILVSLAWIPFCMPIPIALKYFQGVIQISDWVHFIDGFSLPVYFYIISLGIMMICLFMDSLHARGGEMIYLRLSPSIKALLINGAVIAILFGIFAQVTPPPPFIYQGF